MDEKIEEEIKRACAKFYPLQNIIIRKAKVLKKPRFDMSKRIEFYGERTALASEILSAPVAEEPKNLLAEAPAAEKK